MIVTTRDAARICGVTPSTINRWVCAGHIRSWVKHGKRWVDEREAAAYATRHDKDT